MGEALRTEPGTGEILGNASRDDILFNPFIDPVIEMLLLTPFAPG